MYTRLWYNQGKLYRVIFSPLDLQKKNLLPADSSDETLAERFADFFTSNIERVREELSVFEDYDPLGECSSHFDGFTLVFKTTVHKVIMQSKNATCVSDPISTVLLKEHISFFYLLSPRLLKIPAL